MKPMKQRRVYALGMKGWVELREADVAPKLHASEINQPAVKQKVYKQGYWTNGPNGLDEYTPARFIYVSKRMKIKNIIFTGGKPLNSLKTRRFAALTKISIRAGGIVELSPEHIRVLTEKGHINE